MKNDNAEAYDLAISTCDEDRRWKRFITEVKIGALLDAISPAKARAALLAYEATGDHIHGLTRIAIGAPCPGGDCTVVRARRVIAAMEAAQEGTKR